MEHPYAADLNMDELYETQYPVGWPRCSCGDYALDGHNTCGRVECDEHGRRANDGDDDE